MTIQSSAIYGRFITVLSGWRLSLRCASDWLTTNNRHVKRPRESIDDGFESKLLHTVHGVGYVTPPKWISFQVAVQVGGGIVG